MRCTTLSSFSCLVFCVAATDITATFKVLLCNVLCDLLEDVHAAVKSCLLQDNCQVAYQLGLWRVSGDYHFWGGGLLEHDSMVKVSHLN
jgi:hypothetical protein